MTRPRITLIGAGLVGGLLATLLAQRGFRVEVFERRPDPRVAGFTGGRSINLALAERGLHALRQAGLNEAVMRQAVMMRGRMVHDRDGRTNLQRYGVDDREVIWSVSRGGLNMLLLDAAERAGASLHFGQRLLTADFAAGTIELEDPAGARRTHAAGLLLGADGAGSALRAAIDCVTPLGERVEPLGHGYKELEIPPLADFPAGTLPPALAAARARGERFALEAHALHIWPRGGYMCIALPNAEGSFTVTLFLPNTGAHPSFATVRNAAKARPFFRDDFADALELMPAFDVDYDAHPVGALATLYLDRWRLGGQALLLGDAAHAIVPFHGQGMNAGFEDAAELAPLLDAEPGDPAAVFAEFERRRRPNAEAIAAMAIENYIEMRDAVADPHFLLKRALGEALTQRAPRHFKSRYRLVSFTRVPYAYARERGRAQDALLEELLRGHASLDTLDMEAAAARVRAELPPLPADAGV
ncbi:2-polyprenyl-6-methoxyphenol hydroxylase-likeoxidoreductase [Mizugakiibacter sediminis]|uniref:2-polyprenyl-6-methoxyphenol hydroxylase-likeoxidoreductase n=1 Tax=Mizugakiibacter sediminis TaxID=1475481 RepID=A0A0K8QQU2_9GAMM|nr:NAD(P)/FAD-dependent oxidoreductase [Mizugakiibacter sediminis]GAP67240.1 2-polyprenyl-6-methoxyphenol hydroxylase-likeoxidoreductase [Mizugakiibacter sediminis]